MLHVYYGDGKGKTTAAIGLAVRALGCGQTVCLVQFLKGRGTGEVVFLEKTPGITILRGKTGRLLYLSDERSTKSGMRCAAGGDLCRGHGHGAAGPV